MVGHVTRLPAPSVRSGFSLIWRLTAESASSTNYYSERYLALKQQVLSFVQVTAATEAAPRERACAAACSEILVMPIEMATMKRRVAVGLARVASTERKL